MAHTQRDKKKLLDRISRIRGQLNAVEKAIDQEHECSDVLHTLAACRGALNGLFAEIIEGHIRCHIIEAKEKATSSEAARELIDVVRAYLK